MHGDVLVRSQRGLRPGKSVLPAWANHRSKGDAEMVCEYLLKVQARRLGVHEGVRRKPNPPGSRSETAGDLARRGIYIRVTVYRE